VIAAAAAIGGVALLHGQGAERLLVVVGVALATGAVRLPARRLVASEA
jgi:hypothetical protein